MTESQLKCIFISKYDIIAEVEIDEKSFEIDLLSHSVEAHSKFIFRTMRAFWNAIRDMQILQIFSIPLKLNALSSHFVRLNWLPFFNRFGFTVRSDVAYQQKHHLRLQFNNKNYLSTRDLLVKTNFT